MYNFGMTAGGEYIITCIIGDSAWEAALFGDFVLIFVNGYVII